MKINKKPFKHIIEIETESDNLDRDMLLSTHLGSLFNPKFIKIRVEKNEK